jgi:hypothetical protein
MVDKLSQENRELKEKVGFFSDKNILLRKIIPS